MGEDRTSIRGWTKTLRSQSGAIDLASIMVGVLVAAGLTAAIAASILGVIPWAQDNAAKMQLAAVADEQKIAIVQDGSYSTKAALAERGLSGESLDELQIAVGSDGRCFIAALPSQTGRTFYRTSESADAVDEQPVVKDCDAHITKRDPDEAVMISSWDTTAQGCSTITLGFSNGSVEIDWGDGETTPKRTVGWVISHTYTASSPDTKITVEGTFDRFTASSSATCLSSVDLWQNTETKTLRDTFNRTTALQYVAEPPATVTDMQGAFAWSTFNGDISSWDTSRVTNMSKMFERAPAFNADISGWNTSRVTNMSSMFEQASAFNADISGWDTSRVTNMSKMFYVAAAFDQALSGWNTALVTDMSSMFASAQKFNGDVSKWNTSSVKSIESMFYGSGFHGDVRSWDTSDVTNMDTVFASSPFDGELAQWDVSNVTDMSGMFYYASKFDSDISGWNTSKVTDMSSMFAGTPFNRDISGWNTGNVTNMYRMFSTTPAFNADISGWDTSKVTNMSSMFWNADSFNADLSTWNTGNVTDMSSMFESTDAFNSDIGSWDTSKVTTMYSMFDHAGKFNVDLSRWDTGNVTNMGWMFNSARAFDQDLSGWNVSKVTNIDYFGVNSPLKPPVFAV